MRPKKFLPRRAWTGFESVLELPPGYDLAQAKANYQNGFLRLDVPLAEQPAPRKSKIAVA